ncbi:MAG TPA: hypothetical protein PLO63_08900 [Syntrophales bacterium]|nr:hypothetical protein [Syntrophales bacterium]
MNTAAGGSSPDLQTLLDEVPSDRLVACVPTHESLILHDGERELGRIPLDGITEVSLADDSKVEKRYPLGRFLFLGPLALLFPRKTVRESYRLTIQWKDPDGGYHFTHIRLPSRILANHTLGTIERARIPDVREELAERAAKARERAAQTKEQVPRPVETSPFVTCPHCTMEFRRTDLPPGGRCPVCGNPL